MNPSPLSQRELFLYNLLARAAVLLFRATRLLLVQAPGEKAVLEIECAQWFSEARESLSNQILSEEQALRATPSPAQLAGSSGENWILGAGEPGELSPGPALSMELPTKKEEPSSPSSAGGITPEGSDLNDFFGLSPRR